MRILLAIDGSDQSYLAARAIHVLASVEKVVVLYVLDVPTPGYPMILPEVARDLQATVERTMREDGQRLLDRAVSLLPNRASASTQLVAGTPAEVIPATAERERIDLIVMGARGVGLIREAMLGSVAHRVITHATCATLAVTAPLLSLQRVLLALESDEDADAAIHFLSQRPFGQAPSVEVLTVFPFTHTIWPMGMVETQSLMETTVDSARSFAESVAVRLSQIGYQSSGVTLAGAPAAAILRRAEEAAADLILVGSHGHKGLSRLFLGSVSHGVLHQARFPVLVFRLPKACQ
jgi:nucleotide-binding universal stress UspA family protein